MTLIRYVLLGVRAILAFVLITIAAAAAVVFASGAAYAATTTGETVLVTNNTQLLLVINLVISIVAPLLVSLITNSAADPRFKAIINLLIAAVVGVVTPFLTGQQEWGSVQISVILLSIAQIWLTSIMAHYGLWKPTGVTGSDGSISASFPGGIGKPTDVGTHEAAADVTHGQVADPVIETPTTAPPVLGEGVADPEWTGGTP